MTGTNSRERFLLAMRHSVNAAATRSPPLEVLDDVARESDFWKFIGTVAIPAAGLALLALVVGSALQIPLHHDPALAIQRSADDNPVIEIPLEQLHAARQAALRREPTLAEVRPAESAPVAPFPVSPPSPVPAEPPPPVTVERDASPGPTEPALPPAGRASSALLKLDESTPAAGPSDLPRDMAAVPRSVPSTPPAPIPDPAVQPRPIEPPAPPGPTPPAPLETRPGPAQPALPEPELLLDLDPEPPPAPSVALRPTAPPASPAPTPQPRVAARPDPAQPVMPEPGPPADVGREPPPVEAVPELPPSGRQAPPAPPSRSPAAAPPQVAAILRPEVVAPLEQLLPPGRGSGHKLLAQLAATESVEGCDSRELPFFRVIESDVVPARLPPGGRFSHRLVYALCPAGPDAPLTATVTRELRGGTGVVLADRTDGLRLRPGTWASDEELAVPPSTDSGRHTVTTTVNFGGRVWTAQTDLLIE